ncbi:MAG: phosphatase PAP2 family protein [Actinobacteria bacterium]|nr:phosphatase PAP2 family protein [Actinomycetota bacterium]
MSTRAGNTRARPRVARRSGSVAVATVGSAVVLAAATAAATAGIVPAERRVLDAAYRIGEPVEGLLWWPMQAGSVLAPLAVAIVAALVWRQWRPALGALVAGLGAWWLAKALKVLVGRGRPAAELADFVPRASAPVQGGGYPSGHAAVAFALAAVVAPYLTRPWRAGVYALASVVAFARVAIGAHFPLDVVGGAALGTLVGTAWHLAVGVTASVEDASVDHG